MPSLTKTQARLVSQILSGGSQLRADPDALRFRAANAGSLDELDELERTGVLRRKGNKYVVSLLGLLDLREAGDVEADSLLYLCEHVFFKLQNLYRNNPGAEFGLEQVAQAAEMPEGRVQRALTCLTDAPIWHQLRGADPVVAITPKEQILRYSNFSEVLAEVRVRREAKADAQPREKHQKFKILDSPALLPADLSKPCGILGRAVLYIDMDNFKTINTQLTETVVDKLILPQVHHLLSRCVEGIGGAYGEGGDEFTILLPNASKEMAVEFAAKVRDLISRLKFEGAAKSVRLTASIGVAHGTDDDGQALRERANAAKNRAKANGKNRVSVSESLE